jgi:hypothetical protein
MEGKEIIGGYCEIEVATLDDALEMAKRGPAAARWRFGRPCRAETARTS